MRIPRIAIFFLCGAAAAFAAHASLPPEAAANVQQAWKLLDYVATDYPGAVADGVVTDEAEYAEQQEFSTTAGELIAGLPTHPEQAELLQEAAALRAAVDALAPDTEVADRAHALAARLLAAYPVPAAPEAAPDLARGAALYARDCASCHGVRGDADGPAAAALEPPPIAFTDAARADLRSPLSLYQAISQGIDGTAMPGYAEALSAAERWALAYYTGSLAYAPDAAAGGRAWDGDNALRARVSNLAELSQLRAADLAPALGIEPARALVGWLRAHPEAVASAPHGISLARARLAASLAASRAGNRSEAVQLALSAYLDGVEPEEPRLDTRDRALRSRIETAMGAYRTSLARGHDASEIAARAAAADELLAEAEKLLAGTGSSPTTAFIGAFTILVREGLEALLVVIALLAFLHQAQQAPARRYVHYGWILALVAGGITWLLATYVVSFSGASRELTEGFASLFAAAVLIAVGLWMHQKSIGGRWQHFLREKMNAALQRRSAWFLFGLAFISVYREVFETILFYVALWADGQHRWMLLGLVSGAAVLAVIAWVMLRTSRRLPLKQFFAASTIVIAILAVVLAGKGIAALQEAGWINVSPAAGPHIELLGVYPTWQTLLAQLLVLAVLAAGLAWNFLHSRTPESAHAR